mgnify:CR=1 FL=1
MKEVKKITKEDIKKLARQIIETLKENYLADALSVYFNNSVIRVKAVYKDDSITWMETTEDGVDPHDYFEYAAYEHILSISTEGGLYDRLNYGCGEFPKNLETMFKEMGIYYERENARNLSFFPIYDNMEIEYTKYSLPKKPINLYFHSRDEYPAELKAIMEDWFMKSYITGDAGGCVVGAYMAFSYNGELYHMSVCSPWQGELSWTPHVDHVKEQLEAIGCTNIWFNAGMLD